MTPPAPAKRIAERVALEAPLLVDCRQDQCCLVGGLGLSPSTDVEREAISEEGAPLATHQHLHGKAVRGAETMTGSAPHQAPRPAPLDRPARQRGRPAVPPLRWRHDARVGAAGEDEAKKAAARLRLGGAREGGLLVASQLREGLLERDTHLLAVLEYEDGVRKLLQALAPRLAPLDRTLCSMTTFLGVWHQSLGVTSKWLRVRRGLEGAILGCTAPFSPSYRSPGAVEVAT